MLFANLFPGKIIHSKSVKTKFRKPHSLLFVTIREYRTFWAKEIQVCFALKNVVIFLPTLNMINKVS